MAVSLLAGEDGFGCPVVLNVDPVDVEALAQVLGRAPGELAVKGGGDRVLADLKCRQLFVDLIVNRDAPLVGPAPLYWCNDA